MTAFDDWLAPLEGVSWRAIRFAAVPGVVAAVAGAWVTSLVDPHWLLLVTAVLIVWAVALGWCRAIQSTST